jgi:uncharacterized protein DUF998
MVIQVKTESRSHISGQSQPAIVWRPQGLSQLAWLAIVGQVCLLASAWLLPIVSEYSLIGDNISELALGRYGFVQTAAFIISGLGTLGLAYTIRKLTSGLRGSLFGSLLVGIYGVGAILVAIFPTDRIDSPADLASLSTTGLIHVGVAAVSFLCVIVGMFALAWTFSKNARWRSLLPWAAFFPAGALALMIVQGQGPLVGILQRALVSVIAGWLILVAFGVRAFAASAEGGRQLSQSG